MRLPGWDELWRGIAVALILFVGFVGAVVYRQVSIEGDSLGDALAYAIPGSAVVTLIVMACVLALVSRDDGAPRPVAGISAGVTRTGRAVCVA